MPGYFDAQRTVGGDRIYDAQKSGGASIALGPASVTITGGSVNFNQPTMVLNGFTVTATVYSVGLYAPGEAPSSTGVFETQFGNGTAIFDSQFYTGPSLPGTNYTMTLAPCNMRVNFGASLSDYSVRLSPASVAATMAPVQNDYELSAAGTAVTSTVFPITTERGFFEPGQYGLSLGPAIVTAAMGAITSSRTYAMTAEGCTVRVTVPPIFPYRSGTATAESSRKIDIVDTRRIEVR